MFGFFKKKQEPPTYTDWLGSARFAFNDELLKSGLYGQGGIPIGWTWIEKTIPPSSWFGKPETKTEYVSLKYKGDAHLITVAPSRSGKFRDVLAQALAEYSDSILAIDPKGQMAAVTARRRRDLGQKVFILNPFNILSEKLGYSSRFNPLTALDVESESFGVDCDNIADALIWNTGGDSHWTDSAKELISGLILYVVAYGDGPKNLGAVRSIIAGPPSFFNETIKAALDTGDELVCEKLGRFINAGDNKEISSIISTAKTQTAFLGNKAIRTSLAYSDFQFSDLKREKMTVYLVLPTRYLGACAKWFRLIVAAALDELLREEKGDYRVLMMLDEFAQLGRLAIIENAMALAAGYGVQLWPILQDLTQLQGLYGKSWETFLANAGVKQFFTPRDITTAEYISKLCGVKTVFPIAPASINLSVMQRPVFYPDEILRFTGVSQIVFFDSVPYAAWLIRKPYFNLRNASDIFDSDPYHTAARAKEGERGTAGAG